MKFLIFFCGLLALGLAKEFKVMDGNKTCIMVNVSGTFDYKAEVNGKEETPVSLDLSKAETLTENSTCAVLKLYFKDQDVQVWFDFSQNSGAAQMISLVSAFTPSNLFNSSNNESLAFEAKSAFQSPKNESYKCVSEVSTQLTGQSPKDINITVTAVLKDFQAQSSDITGDTFSKATECSADKTTSAPITTPTTTPTTTPMTTPPPSDYYVTADNVTCIHMTGLIAFAITYETKAKGQDMKVIPIPSDNIVSGSCKYENSSSSQSIEIKFFKQTWNTRMVFSKQDSSYYLSEIQLTYVFDENLPDASLTGQIEKISFNTTKDYRKANVNGYYLCSSNLSLELNPNVTMSTKDFKYLAFNNASTAPFDSNDVSECSGDEDSNSIVPIAVGAALAGLVVIVLIAYLIGRRRSKKSGYESV